MIKSVKLLFLISAIICFVSAQIFGQIRLIVNQYLTTIPVSNEIYVCGTFNNWIFNDARYKLQYDSLHHQYFIDIDKKNLAFAYIFSRGDTNTIEVDTLGKKLPNRVYISPNSKPDTVIYNVIQGWRDKSARLTFRILKVPENTPEDSKLYISGNFVGFNSGDPEYQLIKVNGVFKVSIPAYMGDTIVYKFTRGTWGTVEGGYSGGFRPNRYYIRKTNNPETIDVVISSWEDLSNNVLNLFSFTGLLLSSLGIIVALMLMSIDNEGYTYTRPLFVLITMYSLAFLIKVATDSTFIFDLQPRLYLTPELVWFTFAPTLFYFVRLMTKRDVDEEVEINWLNYIPFLLHLIALAPVFILDDEAFKSAFVNQSFQQWFGIIGAFAIIFNIVWWFKIGFHLKKSANYGKEAVPAYRLKLLFTLHWLYFAGLIMWFCTFIVSTIDWWFKFGLLPYTDIGLKIVWLLFCSPSIFITYYSLKYSELFKRKRSTSQSNFVLKSKEDQEIGISLIQEKLEQIMELENIYANPLLSVKDISIAVGTNTHTLSNIINEKYQKNFNDFINSYRVKAFIKKVAENRNEKNFTETAFEIGFNSKATFNRAFKKATGLTPSEYFNQ